MLLFSAQCGRGQDPQTPYWVPTASRCSQSQTVEHAAQPCTPSLSPEPSPRDTGETCAHAHCSPHQGQPARKKDKTKTSETAPPRSVSSLDSLALAFLLAFTPLLQQVPGVATPSCHSGRQGSILYYVCSITPPIVFLGNTQWLPELTAWSY